jgi:hypothetical protein
MTDWLCPQYYLEDHRDLMVYLFFWLGGWAGPYLYLLVLPVNEWLIVPLELPGSPPGPDSVPVLLVGRMGWTLPVFYSTIWKWMIDCVLSLPGSPPGPDSVPVLLVWRTAWTLTVFYSTTCKWLIDCALRTTWKTTGILWCTCSSGWEDVLDLTCIF